MYLVDVLVQAASPQYLKSQRNAIAWTELTYKVLMEYIYVVLLPLKSRWSLTCTATSQYSCNYALIYFLWKTFICVRVVCPICLFPSYVCSHIFCHTPDWPCSLIQYRVSQVSTLSFNELCLLPSPKLAPHGLVNCASCVYDDS